MRKFLTYIILFLIPLQAIAQDDLIIPGSMPAQSLQAFVNSVEEQLDVHFYYLPQWITLLRTPAIKPNTRLKEILDKSLSDNDLSYYIEGNNIYILPGEQLVTTLPSYQKVRNNNTLTEERSAENGAYIQTRDILTAPTVTIGTRQNMKQSGRCQVSGTIFNQRDNEALIGATIYVNELEQGFISDVDGNFKMSLPPGEYTLDVNHMAMKEMHYILKVYTDGDFPIELQDEIIELEEVIISDSRLDNVKSMQMGQERISVKAMKEIPVVMGEKDVIKVAQMLPGVQNVGEGSSGFNVRGGTPDQNMFYINKISVYNTSHLFGFFTAFNPAVINDFTLYKNNIPARYGGRIASVFEISTREGHKDRFFAQGGISPITGHVAFEGPVVKDKVSVVGGYRTTYSDWLLGRVRDEDISKSSAKFYDGSLGVNAALNENNELRLFLYHSSDTFSFSSLNDYDYTNSGASISWKHSYRKGLSSDISFAMSNYNFVTTDKTNISESYIQDYNILHNEFRADFILLDFEDHRIEFGLGSVLYDLDRGHINPYGPESTRAHINLGREYGLENGIYISDEYKLSQRVNILAGLRFSHYTMFGPQEVQDYVEGFPKISDNVLDTIAFNAFEPVKSYSGLEPRLAVNYLIDNNSSIKASYNRLKQYLFLLSNTIAISPNDQWKLVDYYIKPPVSDQVSMGYYKNFRDRGLEFSFEVYNKWVSNVVDYKNGIDFISGVAIEQQVIQGKQRASGVELMIRKTQDKLTGWMSYTYSRSQIQMQSAFPSETINGGSFYPSNYDRPHSFNLVGNYRISRRFSISSNVVYYSGRPITLPVGIYYSEGQELLLYSDRNEYRLPDYFRVDLSINMEGNLRFKKIGHSYWMFNVYNLSSRKNAYSVYYKIEDGRLEGYKLSVFPQPIATLSWHLKLGNYTND